MSMTAQEVAGLFTRSDGQYLFARWGRALAPVVFGAEEATIGAFKGAFEAVVTLADHRMAETDPELGANVMVFLCREWAELAEVPGLERLVEGLGPLIARLEAADANQYRVFRFEADGAIRAAVVMLRADEQLMAVPAQTLALSQAAQTILLWSDTAFAERAPLADAGGHTILRPEIGDVIRAAYDPVMPAAATDPAHALRVAARLGGAQ